MTVIGLTGGFGTGKTFVASVFRSLGAKVIDADRIAHGVIRKGTGSYKKIVGAFGPAILAEDGQIDRKKLAGEAFGKSSGVKALNRIVHPEVIRIIKKKLKGFKGEGVVIIDAPLLIEAGIGHLADKIVVVKCPEEAQIKRCRTKFRIEREEISKRIKNQLPIKKKIRMADFVIDNSRTKSRTRRAVRKLWRQAAWR